MRRISDRRTEIRGNNKRRCSMAALRQTRQPRAISRSSRSKRRAVKKGMPAPRSGELGACSAPAARLMLLAYQYLAA